MSIALELIRNLDPTRLQGLAQTIIDPVLFSTSILGHQPWSTSARILRSIASHPRTAVKACHASGKTFTAAEACLWWLSRWQDGVVLTLAPTWRQVETLLWGEIKTSLRTSLLSFPTPTQTQIKIHEKRYALGFSTNEGVRVQGYHGKILIILDEAPGIMPAIYEALDGVMAGGDVRVLALGNPVVNSGPFYDYFHRHRKAWNTFTISAFDTPNLHGIDLTQLLSMDDDQLDTNVRPYLTTRRWVRDKYLTWGPNHPMYQARVLGEFPTQGDNNLYSLTEINRASRDNPPIDRKNRDGGMVLQAGIDVAGPGEDETVLVIRRGGSIIHFRAWMDKDPRGAVKAELELWREGGVHPNDRLGPVVVDSNGIGYYFALELQDLEFDVRFANAGSQALDPDRFANAKAEWYMGFKELLEADLISGLQDIESQAQLTAILYEHTPAGRVKIESKEDARKRGVQSPDRGEAHILAFANVLPPQIDGVYSEGDMVQVSPL